MKDRKKYAVILLAGGLSSRMGDFKALMPFDGVPAIEHLLHNVKIAGFNDIYVVTGHRTDLLQPFIEQHHLKGIYNRNYEKGMFTSIQAGVAALANDIDAFFLLPVDYPLIPAKVFMDLQEDFEQHPDCFIVPCYKGKKGHPPLFPRDMAAEIQSHKGEGGLKAITVKNEHRLRRLELNFEEVVLDMDTHEDFEELTAHYTKMQTPDEAYCLSLLEKYKTPDMAREHCKQVAKLAVKIGTALNAQGELLNVDLLRSAGLLHDIVRDQKKHWAAGADIARQHGLFKAAELIENHMFYTKDMDIQTITELDVLCLADKQFKGDQFASLKERSMPIMAKFSDDPEALARIQERFLAASEMKARVRNRTGKTIEEIWKLDVALPKGQVHRRIFLIRHGLTRRHKEKIFLGQTDVPLSAQGKLQIEEIGERLAEYSPKATKVYCSNLKRSVQSAEIIAKRLFVGKKQILMPIPEFREMHLGSWDGLYISHVMGRYPEAYEKRGANLLQFKIDQHAENFYDLRFRVAKKLKKLMDEETDEDMVIVTHAGVNAVIRCYLEDIDLELAIWWKQEHREICIIDIVGDNVKGNCIKE
jgi:molybdenum cofactor cytidylyltransferase